MLKTIIAITLAIFAAVLRVPAGILPEEKSAAPWEAGMRKILPILKIASLAALIAIASSFVAPQQAAAQAGGVKCTIALQSGMSMSGLSHELNKKCEIEISINDDCGGDPTIVIPASFLSSVFAATPAGRVGDVLDFAFASFQEIVENELKEEFVIMRKPENMPTQVTEILNKIEGDEKVSSFFDRQVKVSVELKCTAGACISYTQ